MRVRCENEVLASVSQERGRSWGTRTVSRAPLSVLYPKSQRTRMLACAYAATLQRKYPLVTIYVRRPTLSFWLLSSALPPIWGQHKYGTHNGTHKTPSPALAVRSPALAVRRQRKSLRAHFFCVAGGIRWGEVGGYVGGYAVRRKEVTPHEGGYSDDPKGHRRGVKGTYGGT